MYVQDRNNGNKLEWKIFNWILYISDKMRMAKHIFLGSYMNG